VSALFKKLNLNDHKEVVVLDAPASFESELAGLTGVAIKRSLRGTGAGFLLAFVQRRVQVERLARRLGATMEGDATVWFAYPKGSSKRYRCDFNRATGFSAVGEAGFEGVRQVAIDEDWSALRFRRVEYIEKMKRDPVRAMTPEGKRRTSGKQT